MAVSANSRAISEAALAGINDRESLYAFLRDELNWLVDPEDTFTYIGPQLTGDTATRVEVNQVIPFGANDPFVIMLAEFETPFRRYDLREILRSIRAQMRTQAKYEGKSLDDIIFICTTENYAGVRFAHFEQREGKQPKMSSFGWEVSRVEETRTLLEFNLPALRMHLNVLGEPDWPLVRQAWLSAWDVERVTGEFFKAYRQVFEQAESDISGVIGDQRLFTQRLFNRLLFLRFLEKKHWLKFNERQDYLRALWQDYQKHKTVGSNFYQDRLTKLFFCGLNNSQSVNISRINSGGLLQDLIGNVPYLNGGLFERDEDEKLVDGFEQAVVPDEVIEPIINELFYRYNFTVTESTPLDVEVAVDPEMLGKIFEELVTGRHDTGSYYTPKPIVSFMCREALKGYLASSVDGETPEAVAAFVDQHDPSELRNPERVLEALKVVRACDPACGSGAYLLGLLHELIDLRSCLFAAKRIDAVTLYAKKLEIIRTSLYGVDLDEFAVNIARLRLWLSLIVEYDGDTPPPLPNLDFKIEVGDSLTAPNPSGGMKVDLFRRDNIQQFLRLKAEYLEAHDGRKAELKQEITKQRQIIADWTHKGSNVTGFDWQVEFAEVFTPREALTTIGGAFNFGQELAECPKPGGFDIVLANPPYVRQELIKELKPALKDVYDDLYSGTADLYVYFYYRALQLLKPGGMIVFISSNKWLKANYGARLRKQITEACSVKNIIDFGELPVFQSAATFPMIFIAQKHSQADVVTIFTQVKSLELPYPDVLSVVNMFGRAVELNASQDANWTMSAATENELINKMRSAGPTLGKIVSGQIFYGVKTGFNQAFYINSETRDRLISADVRSQEIIKPMVVGDDVRRWHTREKDRWLIYTPWDIDIDLYPQIKKHLALWKADLEARPECKRNIYNWWCLARFGANYKHLLGLPKIIYPQIMMEPRFTFDPVGVYLNQKCFLIASSDYYVLGVLNSSSVWSYLKNISVCIGDPDSRGRLEPRREDISSIPIPEASVTDRAAIAALVQKCLDAKGVDCEQWEKEIDERVAGLYGL